MIDKARIPTFTCNIVDNYLKPSLPRTDYDYLVLVVTYALAKMACANRVTLENDIISTDKTMPNMYMLSFSDSGTGKDRGLRCIDKLLEDFMTDMHRRFTKYHEDKTEEVEKAIVLKGLKQKEANDYRAIHGPRWLKMELSSNSTLEGFIEQRRAFYKAQLGCTCWEDSEIYDTVKAVDRNTKTFIEWNKKAYDHGNTESKTIKGEKIAEDIKGVPHLIALHSAIDTEEEEDIFKSFFELGFARRSFIFMSEKDKEFRPISRLEYKNNSETASRGLSSAKNLMTKFYEKTKPDYSIIFPHGRKIFIFTNEVEDLYFDYKEWCAQAVFNTKSSNHKGVRADLEGRPWKAVKLAALICAQESDAGGEYGRYFTVTKDHFEMAKYMVDYYGEHFKRFYLKESESLAQKIIDYIIEKDGASRTDLLKSPVLKGTANSRSYVLDSLLIKGGLEDTLARMNKLLITEKFGVKQNGTLYKIIDIEEHKDISNQQNLLVRYSQGDSNAVTEKHFSDGARPFSMLHEIVELPYVYSPARFNNEERLGENWKGGDDLIVLDFDNKIAKNQQITIEMAKERFKEFTFLLMPTRSHGIDKKGYGIRDRFRMLFPTNPMDGLTKEKYIEVMIRLLKFFNLNTSTKPKEETWVDVGAAVDVAKMYFGHKSEPFYNYGKMMNWKVFLNETKNRNAEKLPRNSIDPHTTFIVKGKPTSLHEVISMARFANGKSTPCNCIFPGHEDKNPSCFFLINQNGNLQVKCTGCGGLGFWNL
jgi:hypothetical protein